MSFTENAWAVFNQSVEDYHVKDNVNSEEKNPFQADSLEWILYTKNWIDTVQWHLEDIIREEDIDPSEALVIKRRIDKLNQKRTDLVEQIDFWFYNKFKGIVPDQDARINTETPAWSIDRFSILALKIYHMSIEASRVDASDDHKMKCRQKLDILLEQQSDLATAIEQLLADIEIGKVKMKLYKQMKMYNDESLNPILYQKIRK
ncbi:Protein of unknown function [Epilithonimonas bovis DSM 19482]|uniref:DUF4254 domain-containing protein n=1 Tax=Epilithonimonas bovis DSM 19482 TaxID=1121284 RepID=A0A1U7PXF0_9FLAO|nr:DUF4254 domain-containing protein [Epilithonimonas bovis]SIT97184.1 Protein of unknown function [Epilithonimonas bovis DSM 19482]